jgi:hypothetical protein
MLVDLVVAGWMCAVAAPRPTVQVERPPLTSEAIIAAIGSEDDARQVVRLVLGGLFAQQSNGGLFVLASQIRDAWLPETKVAGIEMIRLTDAEVQGHLAACGDYWELFDVTKRDNVVSMMASSRCGCSTRSFVTTFEDGRWHLGPPRAGAGAAGWVGGIGSGCMGRPAGCACFPR